MRYQLVLQWPISPATDEYEGLLQTEDLLTEELSGASEVDGHDFGSGEMNIFLLTDDPVATFDEVKQLLERARMWLTVRAAYREVGMSEYTILWPQHLTEFRIA